MGLDLLGSNFREIFLAIHDENSQKVDLVPNVFGTRVYHASEGWGRVWRWVFDIAKFFFGEDFEKQKLHEVMEKTQEVFKKELNSIKENIKRYDCYLQEIINGTDVKAEDYHDTRHSIANWYRETTTFTSLAKNKENEKLSKIFQQHYDEKEAYPFSCTYDEDELHKIQKVIDLEGLFQKPLPLTLLKKLATGQEINESESQKLQSWINKINKNDSLDLEVFHAGLSACVDYFSTEQEPADLLTLELALANRKCQIFDRADPEHLKWRNSLKTGDTIQCNGKSIKLGDPLGLKFTELDRHTIFTVEGDINEVVVIGMNKAVLAIEQRIMEEKCAGSCFVKYIDVDSKGICARVERLKKSLDKVAWTENDCLDQANNNTARPIANLMKYWIVNKITLQDMQLKHFIFSKDDVLKYAKINFPVDIDYIALEDFAISCSKGNLAVFSYLMEKSTLNSQLHQQLYTRMVYHASKGEEKKADDVASILQIDDPKISNRANDLYNSVKILKEKCCSTIFENFNVNDKDLLLANVSKEIIHFYSSTYSGGIIWPCAQEEVIKKVTTSMKLESRSVL